jgi:hypothetical protein
MNRRAILNVVLLASLLLAGFFAYRWRQSESRLHATLHWTHFVMDSLGTSINFPAPPEGPAGRGSIYWQWVATTAQLQSGRWQAAVRHWVELRSTLLDEGDIVMLQRQGLVDPPRRIRESLVAHPELIPFAGVLGGTMAIRRNEDIALLASPYVFAKFDDGHIGGSMLLEYTVTPGPEIHWKRLWAARGDD